jgi:hypothetical protein
MEGELEPQYGLFAYEEDLRDPEELENPEAEILSEENDLPTTWQVQLHLTPGQTTQDREYLTDTETNDEAYNQDTLDTGVTPQQRRVNDYAAAD